MRQKMQLANYPGKPHCRSPFQTPLTQFQPPESKALSSLLSNMANLYSPDEMRDQGLAAVGLGELSARLKLRRFKGSYGCTPKAASVLRNRLVVASPTTGGTVTKFFWAVYFLRNYPLEGCMQSMFKAHPDTIRYWVWNFIYKLQGLKEQMVGSESGSLHASVVLSCVYMVF
jgi:hypothetical protein